MHKKYRGLIIAIDGPAGSGKSSTAKALAKRLKLAYIDTGAMYRAVTLKAIQEDVSFLDEKRLVRVARTAKIEFKNVGTTRRIAPKQHVFLNGQDVTEAIRTPELTKNVFYVAREPLIRREMVKKQRLLGKSKGCVMEGRDIGTKVFPDADYKFYFDASDKIRARRRHRDIINSGRRTSIGRVLGDLKTRDSTDLRRKEGPLRQAKDALYIDTSSLTIDETIDKLLQIIKANPLKGKRLTPPRVKRAR